MLVVHTTAKENLMAVPKLRKLGQEDSEEQKQPQPQRYMVRPMGGDETEPTQMTEKNPNHFNVQPQESMGMPQIHIHMAPTQMKGLPIYDDGGVPDTSQLSLQRPDLNLMQTMDQASVQGPKAKKPMDTSDNGYDVTKDPSQNAQTHMYPVSGLSNTAPIMDDGGIVQPQDSEAAGIAVKNKNIEEYKNATASPKEEKSAYVPSNADKINTQAKYGDKAGEKRIDVSSYYETPRHP